MMYPVLAKVRYETLGTFGAKGKTLGLSLVYIALWLTKKWYPHEAEQPLDLPNCAKG